MASLGVINNKTARGESRALLLRGAVHLQQLVMIIMSHLYFPLESTGHVCESCMPKLLHMY